MKQLFLAACALTLVCFATGARSQPSGEPTEQTFAVPTTAALAQLCADTSHSNMLMTTAAQNFCHGYMMGAYQILAQVNAARVKPLFCVPNPSPSRNQAIADFVSWVKDNPNAANLPPSDGFYEFLVQRFRCPAKR